MARMVGEVRRVVCVNPDYLVQLGRPVLPEDLGQRPGMTFIGLDSPDRWDFRSDGQAQSVRLVLAGINSAEAAIDAAIAGHGVRACCPIKLQQNKVPVS